MTDTDEIVVNMPDWQVGLPVDVVDGIEQFALDAQASLSDNLESIVLFGGGYDDEPSTVARLNILVVMKQFDEAIVGAWKSALQASLMSLDIEPLFALKTELSAATGAFSGRFIDLLSRRHMVYGQDPFASCTMSREAILRRLQANLLDIMLQLRQALLMGNESGQSAVIGNTIGKLKAAAVVLLRTEGTHVKSAQTAFDALVTALSAPPPADLRYLQSLSDQGVMVDPHSDRTLHAMERLAKWLYDHCRAVDVRDSNVQSGG